MTIAKHSSGEQWRNGKASSRIALAMCSVLACASSVAPAAWAADSKEDKQAAAAAADREKKLNEARKRLDAAAREVAELSREMWEDAVPRTARLMGSRFRSAAVLGVNIGSDGDQQRKDGVEILSVSPGGAAAEARLKAGDVIVEIDGKSLQQDGAKTPREQLRAAMREIEPEEKVQVRYLRDGKSATATVVPNSADIMFAVPPLRMGGWEHLPSFKYMSSNRVLGSAELVPLTPKLGQYFGVEKGLLVVRAPDSSVPLEEGDVILNIDGREPTSASHALRILSSYQPGEKLTLNGLRMKKPMTAVVVIPKPANRFDAAGFHEFDERVEPAAPPGMHAVPAPLPPPMPSPRDDTA